MFDKRDIAVGAYFCGHIVVTTLGLILLVIVLPSYSVLFLLYISAVNYAFKFTKKWYPAGQHQQSENRAKFVTVDATTQTDFPRRLPAKSLHEDELPSDDCEQENSCFSSDLNGLTRDLGKLLQDKVLPDVSLRCGDRTVAAHKAVLAARSGVFSAMFQSEMLASETDIVDIDVDVEVLESFLQYVYTGTVSGWSDDALPGLYAAGDKYAVSALKKACFKRIISNLKQENCFNYLLSVDAHSDRDFKSTTLDFILNHMEILKSEEWIKFREKNRALCSDVLHVILQRKCFD